jgi:hypothetical protein
MHFIWPFYVRWLINMEENQTVSKWVIVVKRQLRYLPAVY